MMGRGNINKEPQEGKEEKERKGFGSGAVAVDIGCSCIVYCISEWVA